MYEFQIVVTEESNSYRQGEVIAWSMFQYIGDNNQITLKRIY